MNGNLAACGGGRVFERRAHRPSCARPTRVDAAHAASWSRFQPLLAELVAELPQLRQPVAAGGAARGVSGNAVWGYLSGNGLLSALGGGWIAAGSAAAMPAR